MRAVGAGLFHRAVQLCGERAIQNVVDQGRFSGTGNAGDHREQTERNRHVDIFQVVAVRAENRDRLTVRAAALGRHGDLRLPRQVLAGERSGIRGDFLGRAGRPPDTRPLSRARAEIHHVIRAANRFLVVLDDQHRVAQIAQSFQSGEQAAVVAGMQADRRLVQHVEHAAQSRADLRCQANPLRFAAESVAADASSVRYPRPTAEQKIDALGNFRKRAAGDFSLPQRELGANFVHGGRASLSGSAVKSAMESPAIFTARLSGRRRRSLQAAHGTGDMYCVSHSR